MHTTLIVTAWILAAASVAGSTLPFALPALLPDEFRGRTTPFTLAVYVAAGLTVSAALILALHGPTPVAWLFILAAPGHLLLAAAPRSDAALYRRPRAITAGPETEERAAHA